MHALILIFHTLSLFVLGNAIVKRWYKEYPFVFTLTASWFVGALVGIPLTYFCISLLSGLPQSIFWGTILSSIVCFEGRHLFFKQDKKITPLQASISWMDLGIIIFSLGVSSWIMTKTFHGDAAGQLFVGSNNVFDFGIAVSFMRSVSWGDNIPFMSPFFAGFPLFYHYFFNIWTALWEFFGVPSVWAINLPSILSFSAMLVVVYYLPQLVLKQKPWIGILTVLLTLTNSSLTFWHLVTKNGFSLPFLKDIWIMPTYPFAGPFDGSTISIFVTLNSFVNQRHLAFAIGAALVLFIFAIRSMNKKLLSLSTPIVLGVLTGLLLGWNMVIYILLLFMITLIFVANKLWKHLLLYLVIAAGVGFLFFLPIASYLYKALILLERLNARHGGQTIPSWHPVDYLWENTGILIFIAGLGLVTIQKAIRWKVLPFVSGFFLLCLLVLWGNRGFEQKTYSFFIIGMNMLAAIAIGWMWEKKKLYGKIVACIVVGILTVSGIVDLFPIKNEFAFPLVNRDTVPLISWIRDNTPRDAVFVSYSDIIDPVALAGRKNYYGYFGNVGTYDRSPVVQTVYEGKSAVARENNISFILVPKWEKNNFPYKIDMKILESSYTLKYEDDKYIVFAVR
jgi:hypothetical protein